MHNKKKQLSGAKSLIRSLEGFFEILILTFLYYFAWRRGYESNVFPAYFGNGKYVLAGVYFLLVLVLFFAFDGFKFGYLRRFDALLSQWISLLIANFITYWQLCLIANKVISAVPVLILTVAEAVIALVCVIFYNWLYHQLYVPKNIKTVNLLYV